MQFPFLDLSGGNFLLRFGPHHVVGWIGAFEFLEDVLITEDHSTPVLVDVGFCKLQSRFLVLSVRRAVHHENAFSSRQNHSEVNGREIEEIT
jgi:hypothetical protein